MSVDTERGRVLGESGLLEYMLVNRQPFSFGKRQHVSLCYTLLLLESEIYVNNTFSTDRIPHEEERNQVCWNHNSSSSVMFLSARFSVSEGPGVLRLML